MKDGNGAAFGTVVFDEDGGADFALIAIDADRYADVSPAVRRWGGPTGVATAEETQVGELLAFYGYGVGFTWSDTTRGRLGVLVMDTPDRYVSDMPATFGDSGGPLIVKGSGKALGIISAFNPPVSTDAGPTVKRIEGRLAARGFDLELVTAALAPGV